LTPQTRKKKGRIFKYFTIKSINNQFFVRLLFENADLEKQDPINFIEEIMHFHTCFLKKIIFKFEHGFYSEGYDLSS